MSKSSFLEKLSRKSFLCGPCCPDSRQYISQKTQPTCDKCLPSICCQNTPVWSYEEAGGRLRFLCEQHGMDFKSIRPTFEDPGPKGYDAKRIDGAIRGNKDEN